MKDDAVSSVVSEMLLIALVLILVPSVTITLMNQLPGDRVPTVNIKMGSIDGGTVTLYHKGGDYLIQKEINPIVYRNDQIIPIDITFKCQKQNTFDLGDSIKINGNAGDNIIPGDRLLISVKNAVIFSGVV